jgi:predicted type IV restriction endonuclease
MDEEPFLTVDLRSFGNGSARNEALDALELLRRDRFDADVIADRARRSLLQSRLAQLFTQELRSPSDEFCKHLLLQTGLRYVRRSAMDAYRGVVKAAITEALAKQIWDRLHLHHQLQAADRAEESSLPAVETTERELYIFSYCQRRLAYLVRDPKLFQEIEKLGHRDHASKFVVYYDKSWKGRLFDFYEGDDGRDCFVFSNDTGEIVTKDLAEIDRPLLAIFQQRVREINGLA